MKIFDRIFQKNIRAFDNSENAKAEKQSPKVPSVTPKLPKYEPYKPTFRVDPRINCNVRNMEVKASVFQLFRVNIFFSSDHMVGNEILVWSPLNEKTKYNLQIRGFDGGNMWGHCDHIDKEISREELMDLATQYNIDVVFLSGEPSVVKVNTEESIQAQETEAYYQATQDIQHGNIDPEDAFSSRGFVKDEYNNWVLRK